MKNTKRALLMSALSLLLCVSMLVGTTFAWFTDSVTSGINTIQSGNLDVDLEYFDDTTDAWVSVDETTDVFGYDLWEPGYTKKVLFRVINKGSLALKYQLTADVYEETAGINKAGESFKLSDYLYTASVDDAADRDTILATAGVKMNSSLAVASADLLEAGAISDAFALAIWMPTSVGNEANHNGTNVPAIEFGVNLLATQAMKEEDSFGNDYDKDAIYPVTNAAELADALANGGNVVLQDDITVTSTVVVPNGEDATIDLNGNDLSYAVSNSGASSIITVDAAGALEISGEGTISFVADNPDTSAIPAYATNTITNEGTLTIGEGVVVTNGSNGGASYAVDNKGTLVLDGGTLRAERCALRIAKYNQDNVSFTMNSGLIEASTPAWIQLPGSNSAVAPSISVTINGGTIKTTKASSADNDILYTYSFGNSHANTSLTINGGEFLGGTVSIGSGYYGDAPALTINGGDFDYDVLKWTSSDTSAVVHAAN